MGDRVPQDEIAADLGVSRAPVREAVIALDREGLGLDENSTRDHYELLGRVYGYGARRTGQRATPEEIAGLAQIQHVMQAAPTTEPLGQPA